MKRDCPILGLVLPVNGFKETMAEIFVTWVARGFSQASDRAQPGLSPGLAQA